MTFQSWRLFWKITQPNQVQFTWSWKGKKKEKEKEKEKKQQKSANSELLWLGWYAQVQRVNILEDIICFFWIYDYELRQNTLEMGKPW